MNRTDPDGTDCVAVPYNDTIFVGGPVPIPSFEEIIVSLLASVGIIVTLESDDPHHILHGTKGRHEAEWKRFGIDPQKPDVDNWAKLLPILEEVYRNGKIIASKIVNSVGDKVSYYAQEFEEYGAEVRLKIWESAETGLQKISDAWANLF